MKKTLKLPLTERQKELLRILYDYIKDTGYPPSFEEMKEKLNVSSNQSVLDLLAKLEKGGTIRRDESAARGIAILPLGYEVMGQPPLAAFLGATSAGAPIEAVEISGEWKSVSSEVSQLKADVFLLRIKGDSMINAGIDDGDVVLVKSDKEFYTGEIVLARVGNDSTTIKRFISEDKPPYTYLKPENPKYPNILFKDDVTMLGKVISVLKNNYWKPVK